MITEEIDEFIKRYYKKTNQEWFDKNSNIYIVRISPTNRVGNYNYKIMKQEKYKKWDKDHKNRIQKNDWLGFIVNNKVEFYLVKEEKKSNERENHWLKRYSYQEIDHDKNRREVIIFADQEPITYEWNEWKRICGYKDKYMPRGTIRSKNPFIN